MTTATTLDLWDAVAALGAQRGWTWIELRTVDGGVMAHVAPPRSRLQGVSAVGVDARHALRLLHDALERMP